MPFHVRYQMFSGVAERHADTTDEAVVAVRETQKAGVEADVTITANL